MYADLVKRNMLLKASAQAAEKTEKEIRELMEIGARLYEAEEMVMQKYILLRPEAGVAEEYEDEEESPEDQAKTFEELIAEEKAKMDAEEKMKRR